MTRAIVNTSKAPAAIGTYSQAVATDRPRVVFLSGQIPLDPTTMALVGDDFETQARQVFENLQAVATAAGGGLSDCVKLTIYLVDLGDFEVVNRVMASFFDEPYPARAAIQVSALPKGAAIEIDAIMALE